jgi:uncharacterized membrane protein YgcG
VRRVWVLFLAVMALVGIAAGPAVADPPIRVDGQITDQVGALQAGGPAVDAALAQLQEDEGTRLFVVFVHTFDADPGVDWAGEVAARSSLGASDVVLAVAVDDPSYQWWIDEPSLLPETDVSAIMSSEVAPRIRAGDWAGSVVAAAAGLRRELAALSAQTATSSSAAAGTLQWSATTTAAVGVAVLLSLVGGHLLSRRRGRRIGSTPAARPARVRAAE